ncbi:MAG: YkvA family protein [Syntrophomonadaceae bacterium]|nr:YkvA family protein [Syntrophomonadaceae bacterium]MDD4561991.1 YkvA family protein [Syntrophomonadaceae bacterium]
MSKDVNQSAAMTTLKESLLFIPNFLKLIYRLTQDANVTTTDRALLLGTIAYVLSPWDFLPDMIPFLGQLDDILLISLVLKRMMNSVSRETLLSYWDGNKDLLILMEDIINLTVKFIPEGVYRKLVKKSHPQGYTDVEYEVKSEA